MNSASQQQIMKKIPSMEHAPIRISTVESDDDGLVITFSDGMTAGYRVEELLDLRPHRLRTAD